MTTLLEFITQGLEMMTHVDVYLLSLVTYFGLWSYVILFLVVFAETGLVVAPFLPGDSLLFVAGTLAGGGMLNGLGVYGTLLAAAILGDLANYWIGYTLGPRVFAKDNSWLFNKNHLEKTREFYERHGVKTIILARFVPIVRTFAPFVAGIGKMDYVLFSKYNIIGGVLWTTLFVWAGYFFGGLDVVQRNFHYVVLLIIALSVVPVIYEIIKAKREALRLSRMSDHATYHEISEVIDEVEASDGEK